MNCKKSLKGLTLVEVLMVLALVGIITAVSLTVMDSVADDLAFEKTYNKMLQIQTALIGDLDTNKQGLREYYGYIGDMGALPGSADGLQALILQPATAASWSVNSTSKTGMGWKGPYLKATPGVNWFVDAWGRDIIYNGGGNASILSYGSDGQPGGTGTAADIQLDVGSNVTTSTVYGVINTNSVRYEGSAVVELYYPDGNGNLATATESLTSVDNGYFSFTDIPFGVRGLKVFLPNKTSPLDTIGPVLLSIDQTRYMIPHNYLDSAPGALPHTCANVGAFSYVSGTMNQSTTTNRVYFDLDISQSMTVNAVYFQVSNGANFRGLRIGNDIKNCDGSGTDGFKCLRFNLFGLSFTEIEDTSAPYETDLSAFPEVQLSNEWTIPAGSKVGSYIELSSLSTPVEWMDIRIGCNLVRIEE
ncbi:MAG: type II secretion system protein GspG [Bdellovibrionota bacterium]